MSSFAPPAPTPTDLIAQRLYELCNTGKHREAMTDLYADDCRHVEAMEMPGSPYKRVIEGKAALLKLSDHWEATTTVHSCACSKPLVNAEQFIVEMTMDCTSSEGPMAGQRMTMREYCLYTVRGSKIVEARFFYGCGM
jgi:hypothetical protein